MNERQASSESTTPPGNPDRFIRLPEVMGLTGRGRTATLDDVKAGAFPKPVKLGRATVWIEREVRDWMAARVRESRGRRNEP